MSSQEHELFGNLFSPHNRRDFLKRAGAVGLSGTALTAFLEACGNSGGSGSSSSTTTPNLAGPIDMQTLMSHARSEEHTSELQSRLHLVCRLLLEKKKKQEVRE